MAWSGLIRVWNCESKAYRNLVLRIEDTHEPGWLVRLYDGAEAVGEALADSPQLAVSKGVELARGYTNDPSVAEQHVQWVQR